MALSRKHFVRSAEIIRGQRNKTLPITDDLDMTRRIIDETTANLARGFACWFAEENPHFDRDRFLTACGLGEVWQ